MKITVDRVGTIEADLIAGTLRPATMQCQRRLGIDSYPSDTKTMQAQRRARRLAVDTASERVGTPLCGWSWREYL
jgi:hypothetical protein